MTQQLPSGLLALVVAITSFALLFAGTAVITGAQSATFTTSLSVNNAAPTIDWVNNSFTITPSVNITDNFQFHFNATDGNGAADLNDSTAAIVITLGSQTATSTACTASPSGNTVTYNCSVPIPYYYNASASWAINASVEDDSGNYVENTTATFTLNSVQGMELTLASISFSGAPGTNNVAAAENPQRVRNTGNFDFTELNITAFELTGSGADKVAAEQFAVNTSSSGSGLGDGLVNATAVTVSNADLTHGQDANETLHFYLDIPSGIAQDTYNSASNWIVETN